MEIGRREFSKFLAAAPLIVTSALASPEGANNMYGLIVKLSSVAGKRDELIGTLKEAAVDMPGCFSYVVAKDSVDENAVWITEVWNSQASHDASLLLPRAKPLISAFDRIAVTTPVVTFTAPK